jgi:release factor glutamine methyltransferase
MTVAASLFQASASIVRRDAELLLAHTLDRPRTFLLAHPEHKPTAEQLAAFHALLTRRAEGTPLQYLLGTQEFFDLKLRVTPAALIPRPETEHLVEAVIAWASNQAVPLRILRILDIGTGTGAIALALAVHLAACDITATDISAEALALARENAHTLGLAGRIHFLESDLFARVPNAPAFDVIVSNPPYIPLPDAPAMQREVLDHEPHIALFSGDDGLDIYRQLIPGALAALRPAGLLALEFGFGQATAIAELLRSWNNVRILDDYAAIPRVALADRP